MKLRFFCAGGLLFLSSLAISQTEEAKLEWMKDYGQAFQKAVEVKKNLFIAVEEGEKVFNPTAEQKKNLSNFVLLKIAPDHEVKFSGMDKKIKLLDHEAFIEFPKQPGLLIIEAKTEKNRGLLISVLPSSRWNNEREVLALLNLPDGSLTQRTLVWAVRIRPEGAQSTNSQPIEGLMNHARDHSRAQCQRNELFHNLGPAIQYGGRREIVAPSFAGIRFVVDGAIDIIEGWAHLPRHWDAVMSRNSGYGYDMQYNGNKWYATGVFR